MGNNYSEVIFDGYHVEEEQSGNFTVQRFSLMGEPFKTALVDEVLYRYPRSDVDLKAHIGEKVTLLIAGGTTFGVTSIQAYQGTLFAGSNGGVALLPKGKRTNGLRVGPPSGLQVLDVIPGYNHVDELRSRVDAIVSTLPKLKPLTRERLLELPSRSNTVSLAIFGTHRMPDGPAPGSIWLITNYLRGDEADIAEGFLLIRTEFGYSEHGSAYGRDLINCGGEIEGFTGMTFDEAMRLHYDYDKAVKTVFEQHITTPVGV